VNEAKVIGSAFLSQWKCEVQKLTAKDAKSAKEEMQNALTTKQAK
jgi:hypothetical protein